MAELNISFIELVTAKLTTDEEDTNEHLKEAFRTRFQSKLNNFFLRHASIPMNNEFTLGSQMLNALASHRCGPGSILSSDHIWAKFVVGSFSAPRGFPLVLRVSLLLKNLHIWICLLYTSPSPRDLSTSRMPSSA